MRLSLSASRLRNLALVTDSRLEAAVRLGLAACVRFRPEPSAPVLGVAREVDFCSAPLVRFALALLSWAARLAARARALCVCAFALFARA